jgi:hypothetical protein
LNKVHLTIVNNWMDPLKDREERSFLYEPIPLAEYIRKANIAVFPGEELHIVYDGKTLEQNEIESVIPRPGDCFVAIPMVAGGGGQDTGKQIASMVAMIALAMTGNYLGAAAMKAGVVGKFGATMIAMGVQMIGAYFINSIAQKRMKQDRKESNTYGWSIVTEMAPGGAIQETGGKIRTGGTLIGYHITTDGDRQYLNMLLCGGEGPVDYDESTGEVYGINPNKILINDNPISNFEGVTVDIRPGINNQSPIPFFNDTYLTSYTSDQLVENDDWIVHQTDGTAQGIEVVIENPQGFYKINDEGKFVEAIAAIACEYKKSTDSQWTTFFPSSAVQRYSAKRASNTWFSIIGYNLTSTYPAGTQVRLLCSGFSKVVFVTGASYSRLNQSDPGRTDFAVDEGVPDTLYAVEFGGVLESIRISSKSSGPFKRIFRMDSLEEAVYDIRVRCTYKNVSDTTLKGSGKLFWTGLTSILYDDFCYPNKILIGIRALATDSLNGAMPNVTWEQTISKCWVFNPHTNQYEQKDKTNPAWRSYDIYHQAKRLMNINTGQYEFIVKGEAAHKMDYDQFAAWANFCNTYNLKCNYIHDQTTNRGDALAPIELVGRGKTLQKGTRVSCVFDAPVTQPVQTFSSANIESGGITIEYIPKKDRANAVEVKFRDASRNFEWHSVPVYSDDWTTATGVQSPTQITLEACTNYEEAYKHAIYQLKCNKYLTKSASWSANVDSIACTVGDVVGLQNDITQWGTGGRIVEVGNDWIKLDKPVTFEAGKSYYVTYRLSNDDLVNQGISDASTQRLVVLFGMGAQDQGGETTDKTTDTLQVLEPFVEDTDSAIKVDSTHFKVSGDKTLTYIEGATIYLEYGNNQTNETIVISSSYNSAANETTIETTDLVPDNLDAVRFAFSKPRINDMYWFGEEKKLYKLFRVMSISLDGNLSRKITALEYIPEVYQDGADIPPEIDYDNSQSQQTITVIANENVDKLSGKVYLNVSWTPTKQYNGALVLIDGKQVYKAKMSETSYTMEAISLKEYEITIKPLDLFGNQDAEGTIKYTVKYDAPPVTPTDIAVYSTVKSCTIVI